MHANTPTKIYNPSLSLLHNCIQTNTSRTSLLHLTTVHYSMAWSLMGPNRILKSSHYWSHDAQQKPHQRASAQVASWYKHILVKVWCMDVKYHLMYLVAISRPVWARRPKYFDVSNDQNTTHSADWSPVRSSEDFHYHVDVLGWFDITKLVQHPFR